jgi:hypothetical protein
MVRNGFSLATPAEISHVDIRESILSQAYDSTLELVSSNISGYQLQHDLGLVSMKLGVNNVMLPFVMFENKVKRTVVPVTGRGGP